MQHFCGLQPHVLQYSTVHHVCGTKDSLADPVLTIWPGLIQRHGGKVIAKFHISSLAHISDGNGTAPHPMQHFCGLQPHVYTMCVVSHKGQSSRSGAGHLARIDTAAWRKGYC